MWNIDIFEKAKFQILNVVLFIVLKLLIKEMLQQLYSNYEIFYCFHIILTMYMGSF